MTVPNAHALDQLLPRLRRLVPAKKRGAPDRRNRGLRAPTRAVRVTLGDVMLALR